MKLMIKNLDLSQKILTALREDNLIIPLQASIVNAYITVEDYKSENTGFAIHSNLLGNMRPIITFTAKVPIDNSASCDKMLYELNLNNLPYADIKTFIYKLNNLLTPVKHFLYE